MNTEPVRELKYGWLSFKPRCLQLMNNSKCFLLVVAVLTVVQGIAVSGLTGINLPALEKRFQLNSKHLGLIAVSNDISALLLVGFISYYGQFGNKIKWIGYGTIITAIGCFMFVLPHAIISPYQPVLEDSTISSQPVQECVIDKNNGSTNKACFSGYESNQFYLFIFCVAQMLMGAGTTPLYSLAPAYMDENVHPKSAPIYLGIFFAAFVTGPGLGYVAGGAILDNIYVQVKQHGEEKLTSKDPEWIGAWWLGYLVIGSLMFVAAFVILGFPHELPGSTQMREQAIKGGYLPKKDSKLRAKWKDILPASMQLMKNPTYMFNILALMVESLYLLGASTFIAKFAELKFDINPAVAGFTLGTVFIVGAAGGIILGGFVVRRFNLKKSCRLAAKYCLIFKIVALWTPSVFFIPGCDEVNLAGVVTPYYNSSLQTRSPLAPCNMNCSCSLASINPVCGQDEMTYFSPCHAGCKQVKNSKAFNCSCVDLAGINNTQATAKKGYCDKGPGCKNYYYFIGVLCFLLLSVFLEAIPNKTVVLRCVPDNHRSYSLGFQFIFQRSLGYLPGPVLFGWLFDSLCLFWGESCGRRGRCQIYEMANLSINIAMFGFVSNGLSLLFYFLSFWFCKSSYGKETQSRSSIPEETNDLNNDVKCIDSVELVNCK